MISAPYEVLSWYVRGAWGRRLLRRAHTATGTRRVGCYGPPGGRLQGLPIRPRTGLRRRSVGHPYEGPADTADVAMLGGKGAVGECPEPRDHAATTACY